MLEAGGIFNSMAFGVAPAVFFGHVKTQLVFLKMGL